MKKFINQNPIIFAVACILIAVFLCAGLSVLTEGFNNWDIKEIFSKDLNEDNLLYGKYDDLDVVNHPSGVTFENDRGVIEIDGKTSDKDSATDVEFVFATVELDAGEYSYTCFDKPTMSTYYSFIRYKDSAGATHIAYSDFSNTNLVDENAIIDGYTTFTLAEKVECEFVIVVCPGTEMNGVQALPCIVPGDIEGSFYAK